MKIRRTVSTLILVLFFFSQTCGAYAKTTDDQEGGFTALADLSNITPSASLSVSIANVDESPGSPSALEWSGVDLGDGWKVSDQYLKVSYEANKVGWGIQTWTDNLSSGAAPKYAGDPTTDVNEQPGGLIGAQNRHSTCPLAILVVGDKLKNVSNLTPPREIHFGAPGTPEYVVYFDTGYSGLVTNPDMEEGDTSPRGWVTNSGNDLNNETGWATDVFHSSNHSLKIVNTTGGDAAWIGEDIYMTEPYPTTINFSAWAKAYHVGANATHFDLDCKVVFEDDTYVWYFDTLRFTKGTHDWECIRSTQNFGKRVKMIKPHCLFHGATGTAWFDDIYISAEGSDESKRAWFWLKDKSNTKWVDKNGDGDIDLTGSYGGADYEIVSDFSANGDDYATIVNAFGSSSGWVDADTGEMLRVSGASSPVNVYLAAKFTKAKEIQEYKTNTIYLELYNK